MSISVALSLLDAALCFLDLMFSFFEIGECVRIRSSSRIRHDVVDMYANGITSNVEPDCQWRR